MISGPQLEFDLVKDVPQLEEDEVSDFTASTTMAAVPSQSPSHSPAEAEQSVVAVVTFETDGFSIVSDSNVSAKETENNQNYDFYN